MADGARTWKRFCMQTRPERPLENVNKAYMRALGQVLLMSGDNQFNSRLLYSALEMPTHCCVPECTKKGYREEDGSKVSYFQFPSENMLKKKWIRVIRRDERKDFK